MIIYEKKERLVKSGAEEISDQKRENNEQRRRVECLVEALENKQKELDRLKDIVSRTVTKKEHIRAVTDRDDIIAKTQDDLRVLRRMNKDVKDHNKELKGIVKFWEEKDEMDRKKQLAIEHKAKEEAIIKHKVRIEEEERSKIRDEIQKKRAMEQEFDEFTKFKRNRVSLFNDTVN